MDCVRLILFTRSGCCLCEGLEEKLKRICLKEVHPALELLVKDIDSSQSTDVERRLYSMEVPILLLELKTHEFTFQLPRISPRIKQEGLSNWLYKQIWEKIETNEKC